MSDQPVKRMAPVIVLPEGAMKRADMNLLRKNGFLVVEAKEPDKVRFMEPPPNGYSEQERAAIKLCRWLTTKRGSLMYSDITEALVRFFIEGSPLQPVEQVQKLEKK